jgi:hypothetical protein
MGMSKDRQQSKGMFQVGKGADEKRDVVPESQASTPAVRDDVARFLADLERMPPVAKVQGQRGRLIFAMDATMSRQPTWDMALGLQADMFREVARLGGLDVQLVYFRGFNECQAGKWVSDAGALARLMTKVSCRGGRTQIGKVLRHATREAEREKVGALVYVGDAMEENADELCDLAGHLALRGTPVFMFQEGHDRATELTYREIARLTRGAYCRFDAGAAERLRELLSAVAIYASGGLAALENHAKSGSARLLLEQLK